jgi:ornithine carbamoyltransferase
MRQMGGETMYLTGRELQLGRGESVADTARVLGRYVDAITVRVLSHDMLLDLARHSSVPVINGLTRRSHPCQVMADIMTYEERKGAIDNATVPWSGDARNNVASSWIEAAVLFGFALRLAAPPGHEPRPDLLAWAQSQGAQVWVGPNAAEAVRGADCVVTDTWASLGDEDLEERRERMVPYQVNDALMAQAAADAIFLHCLPAHRGQEVSGSVIDGARSAVWDEAENRLHAQKGILAWCLE